MNGTLTIAWRDFKSFFVSPLFYVTAGFATLVWSGLYFVAIRDFAQQSLLSMQRMGGAGGGGINIHEFVFQRHLGVVHLILILAVPALTMRLLAEEKRQRSYDLLLTSPVTATQIISGKMIAGLGAAWALVLLSALYPLATAFFAKIQWGILFSSYLAMLLLIGAYVAVGIFASSLTSNAFLAIIMSIIFNVTLLVLGMSGMELADSPGVRSVFEHLNLGYHYGEFVNGNIRTTSLVFFASLIFLFSFLAERVVESSRWR